MKPHKISWLNIPGYTPETWNPIIGCSKVSEGCQNCYALSMAKRLAGMERAKGTADYRLTLMPDKDNKQAEWNGHTILRMDQLSKPAQWAKPRAIFVCSMGDLFHEHADFEKIDAVFSVMSDYDQHIYILLTKRPQVAKRFFQWKSTQHNIAWEPKPNIWLGVTAENQEQANKRIPVLLEIPAAKRFVSIEPMLGAIDLRKYYFQGKNGSYLFKGVAPEFRTRWIDLLDWVIVGGETGHKARPMHPDWVRNIRNQCHKANTPFFFKQWGEWQRGSVVNNIELKTEHAYVISDGQLFKIDFKSSTVQVPVKTVSSSYYNAHAPCLMSKVGRKSAGDLLDGKQHHNWPQFETSNLNPETK